MTDTTALSRHLHSTAIRLLRLARPADADSGFSAARLSVLSVLVFGGAHSVTELADAEQVAVPTMTRLVQGLEAEGWVQRRRDRQDGRVVRVSATRRGRTALLRARDARVDRIRPVLDGLSPRDRNALERVLAALDRGLAAAQAPVAPNG